MKHTKRTGMSVKVHYHGILTEAAGLKSESIEYVSKVGTLKEILNTRHRGMRKFIFIIAVNGIIADGNTELKKDDVIDIIPPMPGG